MEGESAWARVLRLGREPGRDADALAAELAWLELDVGGGGGRGEGDTGGAGEEDARALLALAQDLLKYQQEQVNTLMGQVDTLKRGSGSKRRKKETSEVSPTGSHDSYLETVTQQEEEIRANKEILDQLYSDIAELEVRKKGLSEREKAKLDRESSSSREPLSELDAVRTLEGQLADKNKHIRKMLTDIKVLEEENLLLKQKVMVVKDKLSEATRLIENLTEQILKSNRDSSLLKETIGRAEEDKQKLVLEIDTLQQKLDQKDSRKIEISEEMQVKLLHWKNNARSRKAENENLLKELIKLKERSTSDKDGSYLSNVIQQQEDQIKHLQEKLSEASEEILDSVNLIEFLKTENKLLKISTTDRVDKHNTTIKEEVEFSKDGGIFQKMKRKLNKMSASLKIAEENLASREQELAELSSQLQLLERGEEGVQALVEGLKSKGRQIKLKDLGIKSLVREVNTLSQLVDNLQLENEAMREKLHIGPDDAVPVNGVIERIRKTEKKAAAAEKKLLQMENAYVTLELECRKSEKTIIKLKSRLLEVGLSEQRIEAIVCSSGEESDAMPEDGGGDSSVVCARKKANKLTIRSAPKITEEMQALIDENDGLRKGMEEILEFLKDNSTTTSGTLAVQCPSLERMVHSLDARHVAGWYAPHMAAVMGLQAAIGGRDALLTALHQARKETFEVMEKLSKESVKSLNLEQKLQDFENKSIETKRPGSGVEMKWLDNGVFGTWMSEKDLDALDLTDAKELKKTIKLGDKVHETHLKEALAYFHKQFRVLYEKMTEIAIQTTNDQNKWAIEEEKYKAEILNLKARLDAKNMDDTSENSEGVVEYPNTVVLLRKCTFLEDSYRYIRTLNENIKNEFMESERKNMIVVSNLESQMQALMLNIANLTDRLRYSISVDLFLKQNDILNDINIKYRQVLDKNIMAVSYSSLDKLEQQRLEIIEALNNAQQENIRDKCNSRKGLHNDILDSTELSVVKLQLDNVCKQYEDAMRRIDELNDINISLQTSQRQQIDNILSLCTKQDYDLMHTQLKKLLDENTTLKEQCSHVGNQLEIALSQLQDTQQRQMMNDMEVNMLRHQILDLQATGDNKAIIARLSGEILIAHLQTSDTGKKIDKLTNAFAKENRLRIEAEEMLVAREKIFNVYAARFESKFKFMFEVMQTLRHQYQGALPIASVENYLNTVEDVSRRNLSVDEKLTEVEDFRSILIEKTRDLNEIIENCRLDCPITEQECPHEIQLTVNKSVHKREIEHCNKKIEVLERSRQEMVNRCLLLERTLVLVNQGFNKAPLDNIVDRNISSEEKNTAVLEMEDIPSDDDDSRRSGTVTLPKPQILKSKIPSIDSPSDTNNQSSEDIPDLPGSPIKLSPETTQSKKTTTVVVQTEPSCVRTEVKMIQTESDVSANLLKKELNSLRAQKTNTDKELAAALELAGQRAHQIVSLESSKVSNDTRLKSLMESVQHKEAIIDNLTLKVEELQNEIIHLKDEDKVLQKQKKNDINEDTKSLLQAVKKLEIDKNNMIEEYKVMLNNEREEFSTSIKECHAKIDELQEQLEKRKISTISTKEDADPLVADLSEKVVTLEDQCFKLQSTLDGCKADLKTCENELERWKTLASERLDKIEQMKEQFELRHHHEVESYRSESQHWLSQLTENQKETLDIRSKLTEQRTLFLKQLAEKDTLVEKHKSVAQNLKSQLLNLQAVMSASDPGQELSAIAEVSEPSDASPHGSDRLEIHFHSAHDLLDRADHAAADDSSTLSPTWQETLVERLRREKQAVAKQNSLLRRQIKALAGRERRSRLEAQNLKTQMYRLTCSGSKVSVAESAGGALHNKMAALQSQLAAARAEQQAAGVAAWDKWRRAQQTAERWQAKYEEKCQELRKLERSHDFAKSALARLEREKRLLLARVEDVRNERQLTYPRDPPPPSPPPPPAQAQVGVQSLLERVAAQQRRIAALELADKGHEPLVTEYEKLLSQNTQLKGQVLRLESQVLESQLVAGAGAGAGAGGAAQGSARQSELVHLRSYCETLKEENVQLSARLCTVVGAGAGAGSTPGRRVHDLEQTVLTLRGLVSKLQADQKSISKRNDTGVVGSDQTTTGAECSRVEITNLRRCLAEKDSLLERSRDLLKMAAEREDELLNEITFLRHCLNNSTGS